MRSSPLIFVGRVENVAKVGTPAPAAQVEGLELQLYRAKCRIEVVIRGALPPVSDVYYFGPDERKGLSGQPKFYLREGDRRIFFATRDGKVVRAIGDYLDHTIEVTSGYHNQSTLSQGDSLGIAITKLLLSPGIGKQGMNFSSDVSGSHRWADYFGTRVGSSRALQALVSNEDPATAIEACNILVRLYEGRSDCLTKVKRQLLASGISETSYLERLASAQAREERLSKDLLIHMAGALRKMPFVDNRARVLDELQMVAESHNTKLRISACAVIERLYPSTRSPPCAD